MAIVKILLRKDASSVIVAVALGLAVAQFITVVVDSVTQLLSGWIGSTTMFRFDWRVNLFDPSMLLLVQLAVLELLARATVGLRQLVINVKNN